MRPFLDESVTIPHGIPGGNSQGLVALTRLQSEPREGISTVHSAHGAVTQKTLVVGNENVRFAASRRCSDE